MSLHHGPLMQHSFSLGDIVSILRNTLERLEQWEAFDKNDPAFIHLKRRLILAIAELEIEKGSELTDGINEPVVVLRVRTSSQPKRKSRPEFCPLEK